MLACTGVYLRKLALSQFNYTQSTWVEIVLFIPLPRETHGLIIKLLSQNFDLKFYIPASKPSRTHAPTDVLYETYSPT